MIRNDFVSNSSSSSYVVCVGKNYPINTFVKDVCKKCVDKKSNWKELRDRNETSLKFHIQNARLLFLGEVYVCDRTFFIDRNKCPKWETKEYFEQNFDELFKEIKKKGKNNKLSRYDNDYEILSDTVIKAIDHIWQSSLSTIDQHDLNIEVFHCENNPKFEKEHNKQTVSNIKKILKSKNTQKYYWMGDAYFHNTYVIDQSTIDRTKLMMEHGMKFRFSPWENLKKIQKLLNEGETIIYMRVANSGDGTGQDYIYNETDNHDVFEGIPVKFLTSEQL